MGYGRRGPDNFQTLLVPDLVPGEDFVPLPIAKGKKATSNEINTDPEDTDHDHLLGRILLCKIWSARGLFRVIFAAMPRN